MLGMVKTSGQLELIRESGSIVGEIHRELKKLIEPGIKTKVLESVAEEIIYSRGATPSFKGYRGYPYCTCISPNSTIVHGFPGEYILREGDVLSVDVGAFKHLHGDAAFTVIVGEPNSKEDILLVETTERCLKKAIDIAKEGTTTGAIGNIIETTAKAKGFDVVRNFVGHGIGRELHEEPSIYNYGKIESGLMLKAGMVICIEPMITVGKATNTIGDDGWTVTTKDGKNAAHVEHQIIIHKDFAEIITI